MGAAALGIRNVLCLTGDYQKFGDHPEARGVFDLDSVQLIATVKNLNNGFLLSGAEIKKATDFLIGAAANPFAKPFEMRLIRLFKKIEAGARFIQTQPVFDLETFTKWVEKAVEMGLHKRCAVIPGVMPVKSARVLLYMKKEVPGVRINEEYIERMQNASDPEDEGVKIAVEMIRLLKNMEGVRGVHLMPMRWESITPVIVEEAGLNKSD